MTHRTTLLFAVLILVGCTATAQRINPRVFGPNDRGLSFDHEKPSMTMLDREAKQDLSPLQDLAIAVSKLDFAAPLKARREYYTGYRLLSGGEYQDARDHLTRATSSYPNFVAAHIALGTAYLRLGENEHARDEFARAIALDDHLPISYLNLARAELALWHYPAVEEAVQKASTIAPLDQQVLAALVYAQLVNHHYAAAIETAQLAHSRAHERASIVHYYAAAAWDAQHNLEQAQLELQTLLEEDPKSPVAEQVRGLLQAVTEGQGQKDARPATPSAANGQFAPAESNTMPAESATPAAEPLEERREDKQHAVATAEGQCKDCNTTVAVATKMKILGNPDLNARSTRWIESGWSFRSSVDEVAVAFAATDQGRAVGDLTQADVTIRDSGKPPVMVTGFRSEAQLPLRLGLVIDTSESITTRFEFEQAAAADFVSKVLTGKDDLAFVVGFSNSVLLVQDFTHDDRQISAAINKLAPAGGTALWDAVTFAADKLASTSEQQPVARVLVVISDGNDNSSHANLKNAVEALVNGDVILYAISTREDGELITGPMKDTASEGDRALRTLAENTGGKAFFPGAIGNMEHSLGDLQKVIRSRYLVSYKPALFKRDGQFRTVNITARKSGQKLRVYARRGYYAR